MMLLSDEENIIAIDKDKYWSQLGKVIRWQQQCLTMARVLGATGIATLIEFTIEYLLDLQKQEPK